MANLKGIYFGKDIYEVKAGDGLERLEDNTFNVDKTVARIEIAPTADTILAYGQVGYDGLATKIGDGSTKWSELPAMGVDVSDLVTNEQLVTTLAEYAKSETVSTLEQEVTTIKSYIPATASATDQFATQGFVNSSINNSAAYYCSKNAAGDPFATKAELDAAKTFYNNGEVRIPTRNDYCTVVSDESQDPDELGHYPTTRYYYQGTQWELGFKVNNTSFTDVQLAALNSGATQEIISKLADFDDSNYVRTINEWIGVNGKLQAVINKYLDNSQFGITPSAYCDMYLSNESGRRAGLFLSSYVTGRSDPEFALTTPRVYFTSSFDTSSWSVTNFSDNEPGKIGIKLAHSNSSNSATIYTKDSTVKLDDAEFTYTNGDIVKHLEKAITDDDITQEYLRKKLMPNTSVVIGGSADQALDTNDVAIGYEALVTGGGAAVGSETKANAGGAIGASAQTTNGGAIGQNARSTTGFAGGFNASASADGAVQLGQGENKVANTLQFRDWTLLDSSGKIPSDTYTTQFIVASSETSDVTAKGTWQILLHFVNSAATESLIKINASSLLRGNTVGYPVIASCGGAGQASWMIYQSGTWMFMNSNFELVASLSSSSLETSHQFLSSGTWLNQRLTW